MSTSFGPGKKTVTRVKPRTRLKSSIATIGALAAVGSTAPIIKASPQPVITTTATARSAPEKPIPVYSSPPLSTRVHGPYTIVIDGVHAPEKVHAQNLTIAKTLAMGLAQTQNLGIIGDIEDAFELVGYSLGERTIIASLKAKTKTMQLSTAKPDLAFIARQGQQKEHHVEASYTPPPPPEPSRYRYSAW
jgi:hypothetical protein